jgi:hypothetical protein
VPVLISYDVLSSELLIQKGFTHTRGSTAMGHRTTWSAGRRGVVSEDGERGVHAVERRRVESQLEVFFQK